MSCQRLESYSYKVTAVWKLRDGEKKWRQRKWGRVITGAVNLWGWRVFIKNRWEECVTTSLPLIASLCFSLSLSLSLSLPLPLPLSLPPTSGIYMSYWDWIDCTWEVYLTKQLKAQLVHLDEVEWGWQRRAASLCLSGSASPLYRHLAFLLSNTDSRQKQCKMHLCNHRNPK